MMSIFINISITGPKESKQGKDYGEHTQSWYEYEYVCHHLYIMEGTRILYKVSDWRPS